MKKYLLAFAFGLVLLFPGFSNADSPVPPSQVAPNSVATASKPAEAKLAKPDVSRAFIVTCYTCGGYYPYYVTNAFLRGSGNKVYELGARCSGNLAFRPDNNPYLCASHR